MQILKQTETNAIVSALKHGQVVALPTETVYGLAICLNSAKALEKLIYLKKRDITSGKVFTLVPESRSAIETYAVLSHTSRSLIAKYIPGEITLILKKNPDFSHPYFNHFQSIGIRIPKHPLFSSLLEKTGPLLLTSANPRGKTPAISSDIVTETMPNVDVVVEGRAGDHAPSTIVSCLAKTPEIIRQGDLIVEVE